MSSEWVGPYDKLAEVNAMWPAWVQYTGADLDINETDAGIDYACRLKIFHVSPRHTQNPAEFRTEIQHREPAVDDHQLAVEGRQLGQVFLPTQPRGHLHARPEHAKMPDPSQPQREI